MTSKKSIHNIATSEQAKTLSRDSDISRVLTGWRHSHDVILISWFVFGKYVSVNARVLPESFELWCIIKNLKLLKCNRMQHADVIEADL